MLTACIIAATHWYASLVEAFGRLVKHKLARLEIERCQLSSAVFDLYRERAVQVAVDVQYATYHVRLQHIKMVTEC